MPQGEVALDPKDAARWRRLGAAALGLLLVVSGAVIVLRKRRRVRS